MNSKADFHLSINDYDYLFDLKDSTMSQESRSSYFVFLN